MNNVFGGKSNVNIKIRPIMGLKFNTLYPASSYPVH